MKIYDDVINAPKNIDFSKEERVTKFTNHSVKGSHKMRRKSINSWKWENFLIREKWGF